MEMNRRDFVALPGAAMAASLLSAQPGRAWHQKIRRVGQINMTEHDPAVLNVEQWADYWASLKVDALLVSVTGILAFYPTQVPFHRRAKYLGERDFFGECTAAAKKRGIHVIARMSPDLEWEDALKPHPEWFAARPGWQLRAPYRRSRPVPDLHVHHVLHRAHRGDHARGEPALRRSTASSPTPGRRWGDSRNATATSAAGCPRRARLLIGTNSTSARSSCGSSTTGSPRKRSRTTFSSRTWAAASGPRRT